MYPTLRISLLAFAGCVASAAARPSRTIQAQDARPSLVGTWQLNEDKSEKYDPQREADRNRSDGTGATVRTGMGSRTSGRGGGGGGGGGSRSPGSSGGGSGGGGGGDPQVGRAMREAIQQPHTLRIEQTDSTFSVDPGGQARTVYTDGRVIADSTVDGEVVNSVKASWKKDELTIERLVAPGTTLRETYHLDKKNPKVLMVDLRFESKPMRRVIDNRRIYDLATSGN